MSFFSRSLSFFVFIFISHFHGLSEERPDSHSETVEQSENQGRRSPTRPFMPIACRMCYRIFPDARHFLLHFKDHFQNGILIRGEDSRSRRPLQVRNVQNVVSTAPARRIVYVRPRYRVGVLLNDSTRPAGLKVYVRRKYRAGVRLIDNATLTGRNEYVRRIFEVDMA